MSLQSIFQEIKNSFGGLWQTKERGHSIEIITPYVSTNNKFISVFLSMQGNDFVISDGGWINGGIYENINQNEEGCFLKVFYHYLNAFDIKEVETTEGITYYYLKTSSPIDVPARVLALSTFVQSVVSVSEISFEGKAEKETKARFVSKANEYLKSFIPAEKIKLNRYINEQKKEIRFNAIYYKTQNSLTLINYITGSSNSHFANSIFKANTLFEMAEGTNVKEYIQNKISVVDTSAGGYVQEKLAHYILHLENHTGSKIINWFEKEKLQSILN
jgi:hypothetical protein